MDRKTRINFGKILLSFLFIHILSYGVKAEDRKETVIVLHGIFNKAFMMNKIKNGLEKEGYKVVNWGYPSNKYTIEEHAAELDKVVRQIDKNETINFVGFSLGSIIIRYYLNNYYVPNAKRFVMIAPPNHGSEKADYVLKYDLTRKIFGEKSLMELQTKNKNFFNNMGTPPCETGIILGGKGNSKGYSKILPGDDDGAVSLESSMLDGIADLVQLDHTHTELIFRQDTVDNVLSFIKTGKFIKKEN